MSTFVLYKNEKHDYSSLKDPIFIYTHDTLAKEKDLNQIRAFLICTLDQFIEGDKLLLNGPSYLSALGGYAWFTNDRRKNYDILAYNPITKSFEYKEQEFNHD